MHPMMRKERGKERGWSVTRGTGAARAAAKLVVWTGKMMRRTERRESLEGDPQARQQTHVSSHTHCPDNNFILRRP